jgi:hypothetical protein
VSSPQEPACCCPSTRAAGPGESVRSPRHSPRFVLGSASPSRSRPRFCRSETSRSHLHSCTRPQRWCGSPPPGAGRRRASMPWPALSWRRWAQLRSSHWPFSTCGARSGVESTSAWECFSQLWSRASPGRTCHLAAVSLRRSASPAARTRAPWSPQSCALSSNGRRSRSPLSRSVSSPRCCPF